MMAKPSVPVNVAFYLNGACYKKNFSLREQIYKDRFRVAKNLFKLDLLAHYGCVNAIEFSKNGEFLISGGDDRRVLFWKLSQAIEKKGKPAVQKATHNSNIFCLQFDSNNRKIFSGGNDDQVIVHDTITHSPLDFFRHRKPVYGVSINSENDDVFVTAGDDGRVLLWDLREPPSAEPLCIAKCKVSYHAVMYNPVDARLIVTGNAKYGVALWDSRVVKKPLRRYDMKPTQSAMSVRWNSTGTRILALRRRLPPVLYAIDRVDHLCQFYHPEYYNSCTMKSCSFAGTDDEYVLSGSDDFNLYMWKINEKQFGQKNVNYWESWTSKHLVLKSHRSIVNQVRYNKQYSIIASSGVEKMVKLWSPISRPMWHGSIDFGDDEEQRQIYSHNDYFSIIQRNGMYINHDYSHQSIREDTRMLAFFDSLIQREIEGWRGFSSNSDSYSTSHESIESNDNSSTSSTHDYLLEDSVDSNSSMSSPELIVERIDERRSDNEEEPNLNPIALLIKEKRLQLIRLAEKRNNVPRRGRKRKCKTINKKTKKNNNNNTNNNNTNRYELRYRNGKNSQSSNKTINKGKSKKIEKNKKFSNNNENENKKQLIKQKLKLSLEKFDNDYAIPSTSTGITASHRSNTSKQIINDDDSDSDDENQSSNEENINPRVENDNSLINIIPAPINGSNEMLIKVLELPIRGRNLHNRNLRSNNNYESSDDLSESNDDNDSEISSNVSSSSSYNFENNIESSSQSTRIKQVPTTPINSMKTNGKSLITPDSGCASSISSLNTPSSSSRAPMELRSGYQLARNYYEDSSDYSDSDTGEKAEEPNKSYVKRLKFKNGYCVKKGSSYYQDSDSN